MSLKTSYEFTLPRGYIDRHGALHTAGTMRLATARDELEPLRDPTIQGPDDPRLTVLILARVVQTLGSLEMVTPHEIEGLFAADLAFLQDFYGVINFGNQAEYEALLAAQAASEPLTGATPVTTPAATASSESRGPDSEATSLEPAEYSAPPRATYRARVEEMPRESR
ncbi:hypothetical protein EH165_07470 [Nakamurella antarctica]|uniref:Uncharacterized protein n=1 Tax=Nakamurella antarctica TaxID=1902245 RepID=A0A3G8ZL79_9ACTN|nr:hypothetical protein [Nakamurella antarctica]AZI58003.1 hypothetical protein EH165_07470 [Nakamurella antarctica]